MSLRTNYCFMYVLGKDARENAAKAVWYCLRAALEALQCPSCLPVNCRVTEVGPSWVCALTQALGQGQTELSPVFQMNFRMDFNRFQQCGLLLYQCEENLLWV